jgi:hypothetical protein
VPTVEKFEYKKSTLHNVFGSDSNETIKLNYNSFETGELGSHLVSKINAIDFDEFSLSKVITDSNDLCKKGSEISNKKLNRTLKIANLKLTDLELKSVEYVYSVANVLDIPEIVSELIEKLKLISIHKEKTKSKVELLASELDKLDKFINENDFNKDSERLISLTKFYAYQQLRLESSKQNIQSAEQTVKNIRNFIEFTAKPLEFNQKNGISSYDAERYLRVYESDVFTKIKKKLNKIQESEAKVFVSGASKFVLIGYLAYLFIIFLTKLTLGLDVLYKILGFGFYLVAICSVILIFLIVLHELKKTEKNPVRRNEYIERYEFHFKTFSILATILVSTLIDLFLFNATMYKNTPVFALIGFLILLIPKLFKDFNFKGKSEQESSLKSMMYTYRKVNNAYLEYLKIK